MITEEALYTKTILIYQEYNGYKLLFETVLRDWGFTNLDVVESHEQVITKLKSKPVELLIYDFINHESVHTFSKVHKQLCLPFTICTAFQNLNIREQLRDFPHVDFVDKPLDIHLLREVVYHCLKERITQKNGYFS
ncbi:hypothetical protein [Halalkalibacter oceani]|uniref:Response regulatory domain-containing protein n=1 Tax=Halalkalibacter oceani TaxID=1653776 RepID=A0A9X2IP01_9BACI|nr:hypothetical protein [Halalkalibacter oceani]MCM3713932.1 hypothetical protein [Halalkalibacter oceani]